MSVGLSELVALADLIKDNVSAIERAYTAAGAPYPSINDVFDPASAGEQLTTDPAVLRPALLATSAALQLAAALRLPGLTLSDRMYGYHVSSAMRIACEACVVEILREAGPDGMDVKDIAARSKINANVLARSLRLLASHYIFREVRPNAFANNRISSLLDTGEPTETVLSEPLLKQRSQAALTHTLADYPGEKYTSGVYALVEQCTDEVFKASSYLPDVVLADDYTRSPFQRAFNTSDSLWEMYERRPGRMLRLQNAMAGFMSVRQHQRIFQGFDWRVLPEGALLVDVGGGNGSAAFEIAREAPHLRIVLQDRADTIAQVTKPAWQNEPERRQLVQSGRVVLQGQDFFAPQALSAPVDLFHLRFILHDWPTADCARILARLHAAATPHTRLMIVDQLVPYACPLPSNSGNARMEASESGGHVIAAPAPLLANLGAARADVYGTDFGMLALFNGQERTIGEFEDVLARGGWEVERVYQTLGTALCQIVCKRA